MSGGNRESRGADQVSVDAPAVAAASLGTARRVATPGVPAALAWPGDVIPTSSVGAPPAAPGRVAPEAAAHFRRATRPDGPTGGLTAETLAAALGGLLPGGAIVSDEGNASGLFAAGAPSGGPRHDWLCLTGGAIGQGLPVATGAAI